MEPCRRHFVRDAVAAAATESIEGFVSRLPRPGNWTMPTSAVAKRSLQPRKVATPPPASGIRIRREHGAPDSAAV